MSGSQVGQLAAASSQEVWVKPAWPSVAQGEGRAQCLSRRRITNGSCVCTHTCTPTHTCMLVRTCAHMHACINTIANATHTHTQLLPLAFLLPPSEWGMVSASPGHLRRRGGEEVHAHVTPPPQELCRLGHAPFGRRGMEWPEWPPGEEAVERAWWWPLAFGTARCLHLQQPQSCGPGVPACLPHLLSGVSRGPGFLKVYGSVHCENTRRGSIGGRRR